MVNNIKIDVNVSDNGSLDKLLKQSKAVNTSLDGVSKPRKTNVSSAGGTSMASAASNATSSYTRKVAYKRASLDEPDDQGDYRKAKGISGATGAAGRDFSRQAQGLGGLVHVYATFAANIFAVVTAYSMLEKAFTASRLEKAAEQMSVSTGSNLLGLAKNLQLATGHAISFQEAMQFGNVGTVAGLTGKQITNLTVIAKGAANALGRDMTDAVRRIVQGTAKQEQSL